MRFSSGPPPTREQSNRKLESATRAAPGVASRAYAATLFSVNDVCQQVFANSPLLLISRTCVRCRFAPFSGNPENIPYYLFAIGEPKRLPRNFRGRYDLLSDLLNHLLLSGRV